MEPAERWQHETALTVRDMVLEHERLLRGPGGLMEWRAEVRGMVTLLKLTFGTSILSAAVSVLVLLDRVR